MFERSIRLFKELGLATTALALTTCTPSQTVETSLSIAPQLDSSPKTNVLHGKDYDIRKMGKNIFWISGSDRWAGLKYLSYKCDIQSVGTWELKGDHVNRVDQNAVIVKDGNCIPELID